MARGWLYAGLGLGLVGLAAGYFYCTYLPRGVWSPSDALRPALTPVIVLGIGWALLRRGRRKLGLGLMIIGGTHLASLLGCALALVPGAA